MIYKYKSIKEIIDGIYRDYDSPEDLEVWDIIEWCAEALQLIGVGPQYTDQIAEMSVTNHMQPLPITFHSLTQISYNGNPLLLSTATMGPGPTVASGSTNFLNDVPVDADNFPLEVPGITPTNERYYIQNNCIYTSFESGIIVMAFKAIQVDDCGYPMIPDNVYYDKALKSYAQMMIDRQQWRKGNIPIAIYSDSKQDWLFYVKAAGNAALMPNIDKVENIKNSWVRLKPNINNYDTFFSGMNIREIKRLK